MPARRIVAIVGATATGKTEVGERVARALNAEIVCADSRQVFRELEIGTGKPTPAERTALPHHLFDALRLGERPSAGWFAATTARVCADIHARGRTPLLVGGSGLYLEAARDGLAEMPATDPAVREALQEELRVLGPEALHARLARQDPETAARLAPRDRQRITRALEVLSTSGKPLGWWHRRPRAGGVPGAWRVFEMTLAPRVLRDRIETRTRWMFANGLIEETDALLRSAGAEALRALKAIGYDEAIDLIERRADRAAAEARTSLRTAQLAKRQRTWFRGLREAERLEAGSDGEGLARRIVAALAT